MLDFTQIFYSRVEKISNKCSKTLTQDSTLRLSCLILCSVIWAQISSLTYVSCCVTCTVAFRQFDNLIKQSQIVVGYFKSMTLLSLSTSCSRFSKRFPAISQKVSLKLLKKPSKVAQKLLVKTKPFFGLMLKYANCTTKVSIFVQFCGVTNVAK